MAHEPLISFCLGLILLSNKHYDIKQLEEEKAYFLLPQVRVNFESKEKLKAEACRQEQKQKPWSNFAYWFLNS